MNQIKKTVKKIIPAILAGERDQSVGTAHSERPCCVGAKLAVAMMLEDLGGDGDYLRKANAFAEAMGGNRAHLILMLQEAGAGHNPLSSEAWPNSREKVFAKLAEMEELPSLREANLQRTDLQEAYLQGANLQEAYLQGANLQEAILWRANLQEATLWEVNLQEAYLWEANLRGADLQGANLREATLWGADLREANLQGADFWKANLQRADLRKANLQGADLWGANLRKRISGERISRERISGECISKERISRKRISGERISGERISKERISRKRISGERISRERISRKRISGKRISGKRISKERISRKRISRKRKLMMSGWAYCDPYSILLSAVSTVTISSVFFVECCPFSRMASSLILPESFLPGTTLPVRRLCGKSNFILWPDAEATS